MPAARFVSSFPLLVAFVLLASLVLFAAGARAQTAATPAPVPPGADQPARPAPVPVAEIAAQAETVGARLRDIDAAVSNDAVLASVREELPALAREIDARLRESRRIVGQQPPLDMLRSLEGGWRQIRDSLSDWTRALSRIEARLARDLVQIEQFEQTWRATREAAPAEAPAEVVARIDAQLAAIRQGRAGVERHRSQALALQGRIAVQDARVGEALTALRQAREEVVSRLLVKDSPPLWDPELRSAASGVLGGEAQRSFSAQLSALRDYAERRPWRFVLHALALALIAAGFYWARSAVRRRDAREPGIARAALVFETPIATALVFTVFAIRTLYPQAPRLLWAAFGAAALIPAVYILRRLVGPALRPTLYLIIVFYFIDQVRAVTAALHLLPRLLFLAEMLAAAVFAAWLIRSMRRSGATPSRMRTTIRAAAWLVLACSAIAMLANVAGYVRLSNLLGNALLNSANFALILYLMVAILDGLATIALCARPLSSLGMVRNHRAVLGHRVPRVLEWIALAAWTLFALEQLTLRERVFGAVRDVLAAEAVVGSLRVSVGDVLAFALTVWASVLFSRLVRFVLKEDVYPRVPLARGLPYAISTMTHYVILVVGFLAAVAALGFDMTKVTILAGAFTVGVGFGLQNIFNNFISGLILLFERPVKVGDVIEMDPNATGVVERIGIRASVIRTDAGAELIVPNGKLISDRFTNWTFSSRQRSIEVPVSVVLASDAAKTISALERIASEHPLVVKDPPPQAIVTRLGPDWMGLELRAWTDHAAEWVRIRSELAARVSRGLAAENITLR